MKPRTESSREALLSTWTSADTILEATMALHRRNNDCPKKQQASPKQKQPAQSPTKTNLSEDMDPSHILGVSLVLH